MKDPGFILLWLCSSAALVLACLKMIHKQWLSAGLLLVIGVSVIIMSIWVLQSLNRLEVPVEPDRSAAGTAIQDGPITMQWSKQDAGKTLVWAFGYMVIAIVLVLYPGTEWTRVLSYAGVLVLLAVIAFMMVLARDKQIDRIVADANGIEIQNKILDAVSLGENTPDLSSQEREELEEMRHETKVAWREVGAVKMVNVYHRRQESRGAGTHREFEGRELVLYGHNGKVLMRLKDPLEPPQAYRRFLDSIPNWTKLTIQEASQTK
jgi:hypothetical protein